MSRHSSKNGGVNTIQNITPVVGRLFFIVDIMENLYVLMHYKKVNKSLKILMKKI
jgi:predicted acetyltransferase